MAGPTEEDGNLLESSSPSTHLTMLGNRVRMSVVTNPQAGTHELDEDNEEAAPLAAESNDEFLTRENADDNLGDSQNVYRRLSSIFEDYAEHQDISLSNAQFVIENRAAVEDMAEGGAVDEEQVHDLLVRFSPFVESLANAGMAAVKREDNYDAYTTDHELPQHAVPSRDAALSPPAPVYNQTLVSESEILANPRIDPRKVALRPPVSGSASSLAAMRASIIATRSRPSPPDFIPHPSRGLGPAPPSVRSSTDNERSAVSGPRPLHLEPRRVHFPHDTAAAPAPAATLAPSITSFGYSPSAAARPEPCLLTPADAGSLGRAAADMLSRGSLAREPPAAHVGDLLDLSDSRVRTHDPRASLEALLGGPTHGAAGGGSPPWAPTAYGTPLGGGPFMGYPPSGPPGGPPPGGGGPPPGPPPGGGGPPGGWPTAIATAPIGGLVPPPTFYFSPVQSVAGTAPTATINQLQLEPWPNTLRTLWPSTPQAGAALAKRLKMLPTMVSGIMRDILIDGPQYELQRTALIVHLCAPYVHAIWVQQAGSAISIDAFLVSSAHAVSFDVLETAWALVSSSSANTSTAGLGKVFTSLKKSTESHAARFTIFFSDLDVHFIFSNLRMTERQKAKEIEPTSTETPLEFLDRLETMAVTRNIGEVDVCDTVHKSLKKFARDLLRGGATIDWESTHAVRRFLTSHVDADLTFAEYGLTSKVASRSSVAARRAAADADTLVIDEDDNFSVDARRSTSDKTVINASAYGLGASQSEDAANRIANALSSFGNCLESRLQSVSAAASQPLLPTAPPPPPVPTPSTLVVAPPPPTATPDITTMFAKMLQQMNDKLDSASNKREREGEDTLLTQRPMRPRLNIARIYPVLYPNAPLPDARQLVGGAGWPTPNCAACAKARPQTTEWVDFRVMEQRAAADPSLLGSNGRVRLRPEQGFTHNPTKCVHLHRHVAEHVQANPSDSWMLDAVPMGA